jgi:hypothetical protein
MITRLIAALTKERTLPPGLQRVGYLSKGTLVVLTFGAVVVALPIAVGLGIYSHYTDPERRSGETLEAFLQARSEGHLGNGFWRNRRQSDPQMLQDLPVNPTKWEAVLARGGTSKDQGTRWSWHRTRVWSTTTAGVAIQRLWDSCLISTSDGFRLVGVWNTSDETPSLCAQSPTWSGN